MLTEDISTDITELEEEKLGVIKSRIASIKKQLPKDSKRKSNTITKGCKVIGISRTNKGLKGKLTKVTDQSAWVKSKDISPLFKTTV